MTTPPLKSAPFPPQGRKGHKRMLGVFVTAALFGAGLAIADTKPAMKKLTTGGFTLNATPITSFGRGGLPASTGALEWRGGLVLQSTHKNFGGWSGLVVEPDGKRFLSISDAGAWMTGELTYSGQNLAGISNPRIGPLLTLEGSNLKRGKDRDAEALALVSGSLDDANILVAFEQNARIARYTFSRTRGASPVQGFLQLPEGARKMSRNGGLEAMTVLKGGAYTGAVAAFSERLRDEGDNHLGWIWTAGSTLPIRLQDRDGYDISDMASLEDGSLIVLERRFRWSEGLFIRIRLIPAKSVGSPAPVAGETLLEATLANEIDNMEGLAISRDASGTAILTLISDDNFNRSLQRTIVLQFAYPGDPARGAHQSVTAKARP